MPVRRGGSWRKITAILYRRGEELMSASPEEIRQLRAECTEVGRIVTLARVRCEDGRVKTVVLDRTVLGDELEDGGKPPDQHTGERV